MNILEKIKGMVLRTSGKKIHQTDNRQLKNEVHAWLTDLLESQNLEVYTVPNALVVELENEELGGIAIEIKAVIKSLDYDVISEVEDYEQHLKNQAEKKAQKEKDKAHDIANKKWDKENAQKETKE